MDRLTRNEKMLIADVLNGCMTLIDADPSYLRMMCGENSAVADAQLYGPDAKGRIEVTGIVCCGLEHEVYDSMRLDRTDEKWDVDGALLLNKIASMPPSTREQIVKRCAEVWQRNDENFERDLEALEV